MQSPKLEGREREPFHHKTTCTWIGLRSLVSDIVSALRKELEETNKRIAKLKKKVEDGNTVQVFTLHHSSFCLIADSIGNTKHRVAGRTPREG